MKYLVPLLLTGCAAPPTVDGVYSGRLTQEPTSCETDLPEAAELVLEVVQDEADVVVVFRGVVLEGTAEETSFKATDGPLEVSGTGVTDLTANVTVGLSLRGEAASCEVRMAGKMLREKDG